MQEYRDEEVMQQYMEGKAEAMDELVRRYRTPLFQFALRVIGNEEDARDIAQETFLRIHQYRHTYRPIGKFSTWAFSIAHHLCVSILRKRKWWGIWPRRQDDPDELLEFASADPSPQEQAAQEDVARIVQQCIQSLPFLQREALILREYHNLDYQEISRILKTSLGTVKTLIHRARQNLKIKLLPFLEETKGGDHV
ncbi:MAG: RNA polymerase sigma factor [Candidatus Omnitrophica bacterium]|nr:RNA polymerase sigma factor [Candidatus Omnitrophota bacterium]